jgi:hypothetical protein
LRNVRQSPAGESLNLLDRGDRLVDGEQDGVPSDRLRLADEVADGVLSAVASFASTRGDVALLVLAAR